MAGSNGREPGRDGRSFADSRSTSDQPVPGDQGAEAQEILPDARIELARRRRRWLELGRELQRRTGATIGWPRARGCQQPVRRPADGAAQHDDAAHLVLGHRDRSPSPAVRRCRCRSLDSGKERLTTSEWTRESGAPTRPAAHRGTATQLRQQRDRQPTDGWRREPARRPSRICAVVVWQAIDLAQHAHRLGIEQHALGRGLQPPAERSNSAKPDRSPRAWRSAC